MGFAYDTAITDEDMFFSIGFEQEIKNVIRDVNSSAVAYTDLSALEKQAVNLIILDLKASGITPSDVSNTRDFCFEVIFWVLMTLYRGEEPDGLGRRMKFNEYKEAWELMKSMRVIQLTSTGETITTNQRALPSGANIDEGAFFPSMENRGEVLKMRGLITNFDQHFFNRPV